MSSGTWTKEGSSFAPEAAFSPLSCLCSRTDSEHTHPASSQQHLAFSLDTAALQEAYLHQAHLKMLQQKPLVVLQKSAAVQEDEGKGK